MSNVSSGHRLIHTPRRFYIFMRRTSTPHSSLLTPHSSLLTRAELSFIIQRQYQPFTHRHFERSEKSLSFAARDSRFPHMCRAVPLSPSVFHPAGALSAPTGHLPLEGKADDTRETCYQETFGHRPIYIRGASIFLCAAPALLTPHSSRAFIHNLEAARPTG